MALQEYLDYMRPYLGSDEALAAFVAAYDVALPKTIKVLASRIDMADFSEYAQHAGLVYHKTQFSDLDDMFVVEQGDMPLGKQIGHMLGWFYIQELAASLPAHFMDIPMSGAILDMSAAPGGKTVQLADAVLQAGSQAIVWANDLDAGRLPVLENNLDRTGMYNTCVSKYSAAVFGTSHPEFFDSILLDAPCSGEGTGFKSDAAFKWWKPSVVENIASLQFQLLTSAVLACKPGGSIIYSTCTLNPIENEDNIRRILELYPEHLEVEHLDCAGVGRGLDGYPGISEHVLRCWPHVQQTGGFFVCKLRKKSSITSPYAAKRTTVRNPGYFVADDGVQSTVCKYLRESFGIVVDRDKYLFVRTPHHICVTSPAFKNTIGTAEFDRVGVPILKGDSKDLRPLHQLGTIFGGQATQNTVNLDIVGVQKYIAGQDFPIENDQAGFVILQHDGRGVGVGKMVKGLLKNKFMKLM